jgi:hypothetical protein
LQMVWFFTTTFVTIHDEPHSNCVTALFADRALSFVLPNGATLEDLAGRAWLLFTLAP